MTMNEYMIEFEKVAFSYQRDGRLFTDLSLTVSKGETVGLIGSNGAGKSTLLKLMVGLIQANEGNIKIVGYEMKAKNLSSIRECIGFSFQDADSQLFMTTVFEDVAFGPRNQGLSESDVTETVYHALEEVEAVELVNRPPYKLSGGEKRRVALATVLSMKPKIIVLDEPVIGLDPKSRRRLIKLLNRLEQTKVIATHDMDMALELCDRVIVMNQGKIEAIARPENIFKDKALLERCNLEQPLTMQACMRCQNR